MDPAWIAAILTRDLNTLHREVEAYADEAQLWRAPAGIENPGGVLARHLCGNLRHFVGAGLGRTGYVRDRDGEFGTRDVPRAGILAEIDATIAEVERTLGGLDREAMERPYPEAVGGKFQVVTGDFLLHLATHLTYHLGQVDYHRRLTTTSPASVGAVGIPALATARPAL